LHRKPKPFKMRAVLAIALVLLAPAATAAPTAATGERECAPTNPDPNSRTIVVCAIRPQGYRIDKDVLEARRLKKQGDAGRPHNPHETFADHSCATVGPMGCRGGPTINLLAAAATAAEMASRLSKGQEVGSLFVTDPHPSEYQLYVAAKKEREAKEVEKAAAAKAKAASAGAITASGEPH
jgi:hypothetical protein